MVKRKPTVISTFAGCGGSSLGYQWAGFEELLAIDNDKNAIETFQLNFPKVMAWNRNIERVTAKEIMNACKIKKGDLDILDGSPPCQGFSTSGKRQVNDNRNDLFKDFVRLIKGLMPKVFVMENVSGMAKGKMKGRFIEIMKELNSLDYNVKCKQMNAKYYNVPQSRERLIFVGTRKDLKTDPSFPMPNHQTISVIKALKNVNNSGQEIISIPNKDSEITKILLKIKPGETGAKYHQKGHLFCHSRLHPNKPANTIIKAGLFGKYPKVLHFKENRQITINEVKRLCSFPDHFKLVGSFEEQWGRLGNAVMPKFMQAIAENIKKNVLKYK